jgi:ABC-type enterochelin transport system substrate-binding protein
VKFGGDNMPKIMMLDSGEAPLQEKDVAVWLSKFKQTQVDHIGSDAYIVYEGLDAVGADLVVIVRHKDYHPTDLTQANQVLKNLSPWSPNSDSFMNCKPD